MALSDAKLVVRASGSRLALAVSRLPRGVASLVRTFAAPLLLLLTPSNDGPCASATSMNSCKGASCRLRQEAIDVVTVALLQQHHALEVDMEEIVESVVIPGLLDNKPFVSCLVGVEFVGVPMGHIK